MHHPILGNVVEVELGRYGATVRLDDKLIDFKIEADGEPLAAAVDLASKVAHSLPAIDLEARRIATRDLLDTYNEVWNEYDEPQSDGSLKTVVNPTLRPDEFFARLRIKRVDISGSQMVGLWYDPDDLFWGHSVCVTSFEGTRLENATAELLG